MARMLEVTERARELYPRSPGILAARGGALAAMGRVDEILILIDEGASLEPNFLVGSPGDVMISGGLMLSAHGFEAGARQVFERAIQWFESRPSQELPRSRDSIENWHDIVLCGAIG